VITKEIDANNIETSAAKAPKFPSSNGIFLGFGKPAMFLSFLSYLNAIISKCKKENERDNKSVKIR